MSAVAAASAALSHATWLADETDVGDETHKAGPVAIIVIIVLCVACFLLFRSMSKHLRRVREDFPDGRPAASEPDVAAGTEPPVDGPDTPAVGGQRPAPGPRATDDSPTR